MSTPTDPLELMRLRAKAATMLAISIRKGIARDTSMEPLVSARVETKAVDENPPVLKLTLLGRMVSVQDMTDEQIETFQPVRQGGWQSALRQALSQSPDVNNAVAKIIMQRVGTCLHEILAEAANEVAEELVSEYWDTMKRKVRP